jgi:hypothetical protein
MRLFFPHQLAKFSNLPLFSRHPNQMQGPRATLAGFVLPLSCHDPGDASLIIYVEEL